MRYFGILFFALLACLRAEQKEAPSFNFRSFTERQVLSFPQESLIKLDDGSDWSVEAGDLRTLRYWKANHTVLLYPRVNGKDSSFTLYNQTIGSSVSVHPFNPPTVGGPKTNHISGMVKNLGHIYLQNGGGQSTVWVVDKEYWSIFEEWFSKQPVIIAHYNKSYLEQYFPHFFPSYDYVLLNVSNTTVIPVKPF
jgi:hypothetical protein